MAIEFGCPSCGRPLQFADELRGASRPCPHCQANVLVWPPAGSQPSGDGASPADLAGRGGLIVPAAAQRGPRRAPLWALMLAVGSLAAAGLGWWLSSFRAARPAALVQRLRSQAQARFAALSPQEALEYILQAGSVPPGVTVEVAGVLDGRMVVTEGGLSGGPGASRAARGYAAYALLLSQQDVAVEAYERFRRAARALRRRLAETDRYHAGQLAEQWEQLRRLQAETVGSRAIVVRLAAVRHPSLYRWAGRAEAHRLGGAVGWRTSYVALPAVSGALLWKGSRQLERCRQVLGRIVGGAWPGGLQKVRFRIQKIAFRPQVAAAFAGCELGRQVQIVGMFAER